MAGTQFNIGPAGRLDYSENQAPYVRVEKGQFGCVIFGPYEVFEPGEYDVTFEIVVDDRFVSDGRNFCWVDVASDFGNRIMRDTMVNADYIAGKGMAQVVLRFIIEEPLPLEFRLHSLGTQAFSAKYERKVQLVASFRILRLIQKRLKASIIKDAPIDKFLVESFRVFRSIRNRLTARFAGETPINKFYRDNFTLIQRYTYLGANITMSKEGVIIDWMGTKLLATNREDLAIMQEVFRCNNYNFVNREPSCVIDIGMNVGMASLYFAKMPQVIIVHSFEPFSRPFARALENLALNPDLSAKIRPNRLGLADKNEVATVRCSENTIGTSIRGNNGPEEDTITIQEAAETLKPIFDQALRARQAIVLKMDCEGSEFAILDSLQKSNLLNKVKILMMEWHKWWSPEKTDRNIVDALSRAEFVVFDFVHLDDPHASMIYAVRAEPNAQNQAH
ncbi:MAG: FkbM family methyltransferase [Hyphomicrobiales bacterium]|nr:FkbM family methyltransferase [Hyphomicrobiales bacterium]